MIKIESTTLEEAYKDAASSLECSVTQLKIEVVQYPSSGFLGLFKKTAIIVAVKEVNSESLNKEEKAVDLNKQEEFSTPKEQFKITNDKINIKKNFIKTSFNKII